METHHEAGDAGCAEESADVVDLAQNMTRRVVLGKARRIPVAEDDEQQTEEIPDADENAIVAPIARFRDQLRIEDRRAKWQDSKHHQTDILGAILDGHDFTCASQCDQFVESSSETRKDASS